MCSRYIAEQEMISAMARSLRRLKSFDIRGLAKLALTIDGFEKREISTFLDIAIATERHRRIVFAGRAPRQ